VRISMVTASSASVGPAARSGCRRGGRRIGSTSPDGIRSTSASRTPGEERTFRFCPDCGPTLFWTTDGWPDSIAVPIGAFADSSFPQPTVSVYGSRRYPWLSLPDGIEEEHD
jgi:hypothetical protein